MVQDISSVSLRRRLYLSLAHKRVKPGSGSSLDLLLARTWRQPVFDLRTFVTVRFVVVGGIATRLYSPERMTDDLDILIYADHAERLYHELTGAKAEKVDSLSIGGTHWRLSDGSNLDVIISTEKWAESALAEPVSGPDGLPVIALPYLVLMKMQASRGIDIGDLTRILGAADDGSLNQTRQVIQTYLADGVEDLESLIQLGKLEYQQAKRD